MSKVHETITPRHCVAPGCSNYYELNTTNIQLHENGSTQYQTISYHNFPNDSNLRRQWFEFVNYKQKTVTKVWRTWFLCSAHFKRSDFVETSTSNLILKKDAIPTISNLNTTTLPHQLALPILFERHIASNETNDTVKDKKSQNLLVKDECETESGVNLDEEELQSKCGEIFITGTGSFIYYCTLCDKSLENSPIFIDHIYTHVKELQNDQDEDKEKLDDTIDIRNGNNEILEINLKKEIDTQYDSVIGSSDVGLRRHNCLDKSEISTKHYETNFADKITLVYLTEEDKEKSPTKINNLNDNMKNSSLDIFFETNILRELNSSLCYKNNDKSPLVNSKSSTVDNEKEIKKDKLFTDDENDVDWEPNCKEKFKCPQCGIILKSHYTLKMHMRLHSDETYLYNHEKLHTGDRQYECQYCGQKFYEQANMIAHENRHKSATKQYVCRYCDKKFLRIKRKILHQRTHNIDIKPDPDELLKNTSLRKRRLDKTFIKCKYCPKTFRTKVIADVHELSHPNPNGKEKNSEKSSDKGCFKCKICQKSFRRLATMDNHLKTHNESKDYQCEYCKKNLSSPYILNDHQRIHTGEKLFFCDQCPATFRLKSGLMCHRPIHSRESFFPCKICNKKFRKYAILKIHLKSHGVKPFKCSFCEKEYLHKRNKEQHEKTHIPEYKEKYGSKCDICGKILMNKYTLAKHIKTHTGEKSFKCLICPETFATLFNCKVHEKEHLGILQFKCKKCERQFVTSSRLNAHREKVHEKIQQPKISSNKCDECDKKFRYKSNLLLHKRCHLLEL